MEREPLWWEGFPSFVQEVHRNSSQPFVGSRLERSYQRGYPWIIFGWGWRCIFLKILVKGYWSQWRCFRWVCRFWVLWRCSWMIPHSCWFRFRSFIFYFPVRWCFPEYLQLFWSFCSSPTQLLDFIFLRLFLCALTQGRRCLQPFPFCWRTRCYTSSCCRWDRSWGLRYRVPHCRVVYLRWIFGFRRGWHWMVVPWSWCCNRLR